MSQHGEVPIAKQTFNWLLLIVIVLAMLAVGNVLWMTIEPFKKPDIVTPMPVEYSVIARGEEQTFLITYTKYDEAEVVGTRTIQCEDGNLVTLTQVRTNLPLGSGTIHSMPFKIPTKTSLGMCKLVVVVRYEVNPHKVVFGGYETEPFMVVE